MPRATSTKRGTGIDRTATPPGRELSLLAGLRALAPLLSPAVRRRLPLSFALMLAATAAELVAIGTVLPFLALLTDPEAAAGLPGVGPMLALTGAASPADLLGWFVALLSLAAVSAAALRLLAARHGQRLILRMAHELGCAVFGRVLRQPYSVHLGRHPAELLASVEKVQAVAFALLLPLMQAAVAAVIAVGIVALLVVLEPAAAGAAAALIGLGYVAMSRLSRGRLRASSRAMSQAATARMRLLQEAVGGLREILLRRSQPWFEERYRALDRALREAQAATMLIGQAPRYVVEAVGIVAMALLALYLAGRPGGLIGAIPVLGMMALAAQRLLPLLQQIYAGWSSGTGSVHALADLLALAGGPEPEAGDAAPAKPLPFRDEIRFERVCFAYPGRGAAVREASFAVPKGARVGLVGASGSGKSTLVDLLCGLLAPTRGRISIDGVPLEGEAVARWQAAVALVPQEVYLADASVAANIAFGEPVERIDMERVRRAARGALADGFVEALPQGYDTWVGERGIALSGGQRQRIAIARALYREARLIIFDEATSALDAATERELLAALGALGSDATLMIVTHRQAPLAVCDLVLRMDRGAVTGAPGPAAAAMTVEAAE